jgi:MoCo/4Fe-4S cofactor protein with predicted Tat translocation signal
MSSISKKTGRAYWRSLDDLADAPQLRELLSKEFADYAPEVVASPTRRGLLKIMGASLAFAGIGAMSGCRRWPERKLAPYNERPEGFIPGVADQYATAFEYGGVAQPVLVTSYASRPTKIEGNPSHPFSGGAASAITQASVLSMYDPQRSQKVLNGGAETLWVEAEKALTAAMASEGAGFAILSQVTSSPTVARLKAALLKAAPSAQWYDYDPISCDNELEGSKLAFGVPLRPQLHLEKAQVIVTLDADPLGAHPASMKYARDWAAGRRIDDKQMSRVYAVESRFSITGANADDRLALASSKIGEVVKALSGGEASLDEHAKKFVAAIAKDLAANAGKAVVIAGPNQPKEVHAAVFLLNAKIGAIGSTLTFTAEEDRAPYTQQVRNLAAECASGKVSTLLMLGGNPVYNAPADVNFSDALKRVRSSLHLSEYFDETSQLSGWHLPQSHYLEAWGDARSFDGTVSIVQPLIYPLYDSRSAIEVLAAIVGEKGDGLALVQATLNPLLPTDTVGKSWRKALRDGLVEGSAAASIEPKVSTTPIDIPAAPAGLEVVLSADSKVYDGRFAYNGWLQELPDSLTKLVWDNAALISPVTAASFKPPLKQRDLVSIKAGGREVTAAIYIMPGQAIDSISLSLGYGRSAGNDVAVDVGHSAYGLLTTAAATILTGADVSSLGRSYTLVTTQEHHIIDEGGMRERGQRVGHIVRQATIEDLTREPNLVAEMNPEVPKMKSNDGKRTVPLQIWDDPVNFNGENKYQWGMAIDLAMCIGCNACTVACQAENNIPIVGKEQVERGREMHWIRIDRYFVAKDAGGEPVYDLESLSKPETTITAVHQPMTCHHCENAPCESVCPVAATTHDSEGINVMIYNRCVGTRYCSNNCPYKVRRFNYFDWHSKPPKGPPSSGTFLGFPDQQQEVMVEQVRRLGFNPDVTVRMRGVMEKCTFCTQRIKAVTIPVRNEFRQGKRKDIALEDGAITPACAQTCPTRAITFGNIADPNSRVAKLQKAQRAYEVLEELNVRARVRYLARVTNPGTAVAHAAHAPEHNG